MNLSQLQSGVMTPKKTISLEVWECRHCKAIRPLGGEKPERCWNYKCRRMDWDRPKIKTGRPRTKLQARKRPAKKRKK